MKESLKIPTSLSKITLGQLLSFANILKAIEGSDMDPSKVNYYDLSEDLSIIGWGTPEMKHVLSVENIDALYAASVLAVKPVFEDYSNQVKEVNFIDSFKVPMAYIENRNSIMSVTMKINGNVNQLPAELWGAILSKHDKLGDKAPIHEEIKLIPFVLARLAWKDHEEMFKKDASGGTVINNALINAKERGLLGMNALDATRAFTFFLTIRGIYSTAPSLLSSEKNLTTRISNLRQNVRRLQSDGGGLDLSKILSQKAMTGYSKQN